MDFVNIFITYSGRINRAKFWIGELIIGVISRGLVMTAFFAGRGTTISFIANIANLLVVISGFGVGVKRLHDRNKSGWFILLFLFLPIVLFGIGERIVEVSDIA